MLRFLHCADLHLDSPFAGLTPEQAASRRTLQRDLPRQIVRLANDHQCQLILCSGDVFDHRQVCPETIRALRDALEACPCPVLIAPGNHDPYGELSPWTAVRWPENVHLFHGPWESLEFPDLDCRVWGAGFTAAECYDPLPAVPEDGLMQLAVLHGDLQPGPYRYLSKEAIEGSHLDYLALGHIHQTQLPRKLGSRVLWMWPRAR